MDYWIHSSTYICRSIHTSSCQCLVLICTVMYKHRLQCAWQLAVTRNRTPLISGTNPEKQFSARADVFDALISSEEKLRDSGLPDFSWSKYTKTEKYTKIPQTIPKSHKLYQMAVIFQMVLKYNNIFHSKFYQNWNFWFENKPSSNPGEI
jgi:hypothetical protein